MPERARGLGEASGHGSLRSGARERRFPRQHLVEHGTERVDVGAAIERLVPARLLRAHVGRGAHAHPGLGQVLIAPYRPGDPKIGDQRVAILGQQQVFGFDVAVHDAVVMSILERLGRFTRNPKRVLHPELPLPPQPVPQRLALHEWHGEPELAGGLVRVVDGENVWVLEPGGEPDLALEPVGPQRGGDLR